MRYDLARHYGHEIEIGLYADGDDPVNYAVECMTCYEVIIDEDTEPEEEN